MPEVLYVVTVCDYDGIRAHLSSEVFTMEENARKHFNYTETDFLRERYDETSHGYYFDDEDVDDDDCHEYWWNNSTRYWQIKLEVVCPK